MRRSAASERLSATNGKPTGTHWQLTHPCQLEGDAYYVQTYKSESTLAKVQKLLEGTCATEAKKYESHWEFFYDGDGARVRQLLSAYDPDTQAVTPVTITSYFMGGLYEETRAVAGQAPGVTTKYSAVAGMTVAMRDSSGLKYLLTDHLGSVVAVTDDGGTLISHSLRSRYLPFGGLRVSVGNSPRVTQTDHAHTGQRAADERTPRRSD